VVLEAFGAAVIGFAIAYAATKRLPARFANRRLVLATGPVSAVLGGVVSRVVLGPGYAPVTLLVGAAVSVAILSLLLGDSMHTRRPSSGFRANVAGSPRV